jgi:hypothetical protein
MGRTVITIALMAIFIALGLLHVHWVFGGSSGRIASVPSVNGKPLFTPSPVGTLLVAVCLFLAAVVMAGVAGWLGAAVPRTVFRLLTLGISVVFLLRAVGDWRNVGFFQRRSESAFAYWDVRLYSPLCLLIAAGALVLAWSET